jgi:hypothetical protein
MVETIPLPYNGLPGFLMTAINIQDSTYRRLRAQADARRLSLDAYLDIVADSGNAVNADSNRQLAALESFASDMGNWSEIMSPQATSLTTAATLSTRAGANEVFARHEHPSTSLRGGACSSQFCARRGETTCARWAYFLHRIADNLRIPRGCNPVHDPVAVAARPKP